MAHVADDGLITTEATYKYLSGLGFGQKTAQVLTDVMLMQDFGEPPAGVDPLEFDRTLQTCLAVYKDPAKSAADVKSGDCGMVQE